MDLILIRHGRPERVDFDANGANPALTELGHHQASLMANYLAPEPIDAIYVSPQQRAIDTAAPLAEATGLTPIIVDGIAEFDVEHKTYIPGEEMGPLTDDERNSMIAAFTADAFVDRVMAAIDSIIADHPGQTVAAVCHGGVISTVLAHTLRVDRMRYFDSQYTSVTRVRASSTGKRSMFSFNECHWLPDRIEPRR